MSREQLMAPGIGVTEHASAADTAQGSSGGLRRWRLLPALPRDPLPLQTGSLDSRGAPRERKLPLGLSSGFAKEEKWNWVLGRSLGGFPAWEPSATVYNVQKTTRRQRSFEALGSAC